MMKFKIPTDEEIEERYKVKYENEKNNKNNFSYWYPKIKDCGIKVVDCKIYQLPFEQYFNMNKDTEFDDEMWDRFCEQELKDLHKYKLYNLKNGTYSDKFNFVHCIGGKGQISQKIRNINYSSMLVGAGGMTEFVVRDVIQSDSYNTPKIYNGMPLRTEFRVFYDFNTHEVKHIHNYWDYDYCIKGMYDITDKIVFDYMKEKITKTYEEKKNEVVEIVLNAFKTNNDLTGIWSIDIMFVEEEQKYYLIDMAEGEKSAYWLDCKKEMGK